MKKGRMEAFSDGVLAIIITIMILEIKVPHGNDWHSLVPLVPKALSYLLSFALLAIYWNNHHHLLHTVKKVTAGVLWSNLHLLFWLSLIPFTTGWMGEYNFSQLPTALYGVNMVFAGVSYYILQNVILSNHGNDSPLAQAIGKDYKGKASLLIYSASVGTAFIATWISALLFIAVAIMWIVPDKRIEKLLANGE